MDKGMTIVSEALLAVGIIMVSMAFVLVGGNIISFQTEGLFGSTQNQMPDQISSIINELPKSSGEFSTTYSPEIESYTLQIQENRTITADISDSGRSSTEFLDYRIENTVIRNADEICIRKQSRNVTLSSGSCDTGSLSNFCANGRCINGVCQPSKGETCANSGGDCTCPGDAQSTGASSICKPDYKAENFINAPGAGDSDVDSTQPIGCVETDYIGAQLKGDNCNYDFECNSGECKDPHYSAPSGITQERCCPSDKAWNGTACQSENNIHLVYVPLNKNTPKYDNAVSQQSQVVKDEYPVNPDKIKVSKINDVCTVPINPSSCTSSEKTQTLNKIENCVADAGYTDYDLPVGVFQEDVCGPTAGFTHPSVDASTAEWNNDIVSAHEMGHQYGLNDEYLDVCRYSSVGGAVSPVSSNCLKQSLNGDRGLDSSLSSWTDNSPFCAGGGSTAPGYSVFCRGNENPSGGRDIMSSAGAPGPREFAQPSLNYLKSLSDFS